MNEYRIVFREGPDAIVHAPNIAEALLLELPKALNNPIDKIEMLSWHKATELPCYGMLVHSIKDLDPELVAQFIRLEMPLIIAVDYAGDEDPTLCMMHVYWDDQDIPEGAEFVIYEGYGDGTDSLAVGRSDEMNDFAKRYVARQQTLFPGLNIATSNL